MKKLINEEFKRMQLLAGLITESEYKQKKNLFEVEAKNISPENAVEKAISLTPKLEKSSELDALAQKIANDPNLVSQMEKALQKGGISLNENENNLDIQDMKTVALNFAKKGQQVQEEETTWDDAAAGAYMGAFVGGGALAGSFSSAIAAAIPMAASLFAGPAFVGALAGVALVALARKVYLLTKK
jgi:hypothetical protein